MFRHSIILAAGEGTRLLPLTYNTCKAMVKVGDSYLITSILNQIVNYIRNVSVTVGNNPEELIKYAFQIGAKTIINTCGKDEFWWLFNSIYTDLDEPVLVLPCDVITNINIDFLYKSYEELGSPYCMIVPIPSRDGFDGDFIFGDKNNVLKISRLERTSIYCSGIQIVNPKAIATLIKNKNDQMSVWNELIKIRQLKYSEFYPEFWYTINSVKQLNAYLKIARDEFINSKSLY